MGMARTARGFPRAVLTLHGDDLGAGLSYSTISPSAWKCPISTVTRSPGFTRLPEFEKAIQYDLPSTGVLLCRNFPTFSIWGTTSLTPACGS